MKIEDIVKNDQFLSDFVKEMIEYLNEREGWTKHGSYKKIASRAGLTQIDITRLIRIKDHAKDSNVQLEKVKKIIHALKVKYHVESKDNMSFSRLRPIEDEKIEELATKLALNLVDVSTRFNEFNTPHKKIIRKERLKKYRGDSFRRERFILLTGAGISHVATKGVMPLAKDAIEYIKDEVDRLNIPRSIFEEEAKQLKLSTQLDINEFENQLLIYSKYAPKAVKEGLKKICRPKHVPNIEYETLAHMLKHRFIDIAINFNYDEIFDVILKEEISNGEFKYIYLEGHCPDSYEKEFLINNRLKQPVYIKPHGTISHTSSLRLNREQISTLPLEIRKLISNIIESKVQEYKHYPEQKFLDVNFIVVGFGMKSPVLLEAIKEYLDNEKYENPPKFWFFDKKKNLEEFSLGLEPKYRKIIEENSHFFCVDEEDTLGSYLNALWKKTAESFSEDYPPTGIERHELINLIFDDSKDTITRRREKADQEVYFKDRLFVELALDILSSDGILNIQQIMSGRVDYYLKKYNELVDDGSRLSIDSIIKELGLKNYKDFISDVYTSLNPNKFGSFDFLSDFHEKLSKQLSSERKYYYQNNVEYAIGLSEEINRRNRLKINPQFSHPHNGLFSPLRPEQILNTSLNWIYRYRESLEKGNWDLLLTVSERGRFLTSTRMQDKYDRIFEDKKSEIILSSLDMPNVKNRINEDSFKKFNLLSERIMYLPWWLHNRHLVLFMKKKEITDVSREIDRWNFVSGFFYESRMLSRTVNPILLTEETDLKKLFYIFVLYWHKSREYTVALDNGGLRSIPIIDNNGIHDQADELLSKYK